METSGSVSNFKSTIYGCLWLPDVVGMAAGIGPAFSGSLARRSDHLSYAIQNKSLILHRQIKTNDYGKI